MDRKDWSKVVRIELIKLGMKEIDLARKLGVSKQHLYDTLSNRRGYPNDKMIKDISEILSIELPEERGEQ